MADFTAIASVGKSLERFLSACFTDPLVPVPAPGSTTKAVLARTEDFDKSGGGQIAAAVSVDLSVSHRLQQDDARGVVRQSAVRTDSATCRSICTTC